MDLDPIVTDGPGAWVVSDHPFTPRAEWFTTCGHEVVKVEERGATHRKPCGLAEAAHATSTLTPRERRPTPFPVAEIDLSEAQEHMVENGNGHKR